MFKVKIDKKEIYRESLTVGDVFTTWEDIIDDRVELLEDLRKNTLVKEVYMVLDPEQSENGFNVLSLKDGCLRCSNEFMWHRQDTVFRVERLTLTKAKKQNVSKYIRNS